jgi:hypothetical protein
LTYTGIGYEISNRSFDFPSARHKRYIVQRQAAVELGLSVRWENFSCDWRAQGDGRSATLAAAATLEPESTKPTRHVPFSRWKFVSDVALHQRQ